MSLYGVMRTGVSGMNAQANRLSTVADNIANSDTTGYKRSSTEFSTLIMPTHRRRLHFRRRQHADPLDGQLTGTSPTRPRSPTSPSPAMAS